MTVFGESKDSCIYWNYREGKGKGEKEKREENACYNNPTFSSAHQFHPNPIMLSVKITANQNIQILKRTGTRMQFY